MLKRAEAGVFNVAYIETGPSNGPPAQLLHGFPYDEHSDDEVTPLLVSAQRPERKSSAAATPPFV
jgi:hypothetical protein